MTTETKVNPDPRAEYIAGLRALADLLEAHPELDLPAEGKDYMPLGVYPLGSDAQREQLAAWAKALPGKREKKTNRDGDILKLLGQLRGFHVQVVCDRDNVCERVVTGTETVTKKVKDPEALAAVPEIEVTEEVEQYEWVCRPLLADAPELEAVSA